MTAGVYLLRDPTNGIVRYVGKSKNIEQRYKQHCMSRASNQRLSRWIEELHHLGLRPVIERVKVPITALERVENMYIRRHFATVFNGHYDFCGYRYYSDDSVWTPPAVSAYCVFYHVRDAYLEKLRARAVRFGHNKWRLQQGFNVLKRGCAFALKVLQRANETRDFFRGCWLEEGYMLTCGDNEKLKDAVFAVDRWALVK